MWLCSCRCSCVKNKVRWLALPAITSQTVAAAILRHNVIKIQPQVCIPASAAFIPLVEGRLFLVNQHCFGRLPSNLAKLNDRAFDQPPTRHLLHPPPFAAENDALLTPTHPEKREESLAAGCCVLESCVGF